MSKVCITSLVLLLSGCMNADRRYESWTGQVGYCSGTAFGLVSTIVTAVELDKCGARWREAGYEEVSR